MDLKSAALLGATEAYYDSAVSSWSLHGGGATVPRNKWIAGAADRVLLRMLGSAAYATNFWEWQDSGANNLGWIGPDGSMVLQSNLTVNSTFNQVPLSFSLPINTINGNSNWMTFAHGTVPSGKTVTINYVQSLLDNGNAPGTDQVVRIYDATGASTLLATNGNWNGTVTITNGLRWYARFENNSTTNINVSASIHGNIK